MNIIICTIKQWNVSVAKKFQKEHKKNYNIKIINNKNELTEDMVEKFNPDYIFFPHWSYYIPKEIYENFNCIVFHMTDLPFGRGGSPLQNLIVRGIKNTKITAIQVCNEIDAGKVYLKNDLELYGTAEEIFIRASTIIFNEMIPIILRGDIMPLQQTGEIVEFKRRSSEESEIFSDMSLEKIYDYIRMLDGEGYPNAYIQFGKYKLSFSRASIKHNKIIADVEIMEEVDE